jgi:hypothetical protein
LSICVLQGADRIQLKSGVGIPEMSQSPGIKYSSSPGQ